MGFYVLLSQFCNGRILPWKAFCFHENRAKRSKVYKYIDLFQEYLENEEKAVANVNSVLSSLNGFFAFMGWNQLNVKTIVDLPGKELFVFRFDDHKSV